MSCNDEDKTPEAMAFRAAQVRAAWATKTPEEKERAFYNLVDFLADMEAEDVMTMSDAEIRADLEADGVDVDAMVARICGKIDEAVAKAKAERDAK